jgi:hypothetical protein
MNILLCVSIAACTLSLVLHILLMYLVHHTHILSTVLAAHDKGAYGESLCSDVVGGYHGAFVLRIAHFFESCANRDGKFAAVVK